MKCIIFDCDGVLVDSEMIASQRFTELLAQAGYIISIENSIQRFTGKASNFIYEEINAEISSPLTENQIKHIQTLVHQAIHAEVIATPGITDLIKKLTQQNYKICVASSGNLEKINKSLLKAGLSGYFSSATIFSVEHVKVGKPAPDLFLYAAKSMGYLPQECVVIEDSLAGIEAAIAAHIPVIGFLGGSHAHYDWYQERMADYSIPIAHDCDELTKLLNLY